MADIDNVISRAYPEDARIIQTELDQLREEVETVRESKNGHMLLWDKALKRAEKAEADVETAKGEADALCMAIYNQHFKAESPNFELCDSTDGVISQIDNMVAGLLEKAESEVERLKADISQQD